MREITNLRKMKNSEKNTSSTGVQRIDITNNPIAPDSFLSRSWIAKNSSIVEKITTTNRKIYIKEWETSLIYGVKCPANKQTGPFIISTPDRKSISFSTLQSDKNNKATRLILNRFMNIL